MSARARVVAVVGLSAVLAAAFAWFGAVLGWEVGGHNGRLFAGYLSGLLGFFLPWTFRRPQSADVSREPASHVLVSVCVAGLWFEAMLAAGLLHLVAAQIHVDSGPEDTFADLVFHDAATPVVLIGVTVLGLGASLFYHRSPGAALRLVLYDVLFVLGGAAAILFGMDWESFYR
jgi:hypothetical protein